MGLSFTYQVPKNNQLQFLDLRLTCGKSHACWKYDPRSVKPILNYKSGHYKIVKPAIAKAILNASLKKSCLHMSQPTFRDQVNRLIDAAWLP